ncbi:hypothetical protein C8P68_1173 [Mucilaginibacter yixingensis]|uniref:Uncharacterized protein n=1 Tax=Mucilaginibacter yixingensis TaxID=1295612 RepID=A0A2T5J4A3_9SPHI|nr:hypothetical protein [Mucilaginibacter yixingensis]PTQ91830.1 hypothetical protein C8P68_1173 [Mucilaginibacter yixingensis]
MYIIDLDGKKIEVTDLDLAIMQADDFRHYRVTKPSEYQRYLYKYWEDFYQKLLRIKDA